jgi:NAD(P)-dependent dehydrogenase (short-subunit alcohol dehydrogenase family)
MRALVTGASYGIGGAVCKKLAQDALAKGEAAKIVAAATGSRPDLLELVDELRKMGADAKAVTGDLSDPIVPHRLIDEAVAFCGGLDALVSNAAARYQAPLLEMKVQDWNRVYAVNVTATLLLAQAAHPHLKKSGGAIVITTSIAGSFPHANYGPYSSSKAALIMLMQQLASEFARDGIRVNGVAPGATKTRMNAPIYAIKEMADARAAIIPMGRPGDASEQASVAAFLLGKEASYVTGQNITVDGAFAQSIMAFMPGRHAKELTNK